MPLPYRESSGVPYKISVGTLPVQLNKTGDWRFLTPVRREKVSPCTAQCPLHNGIAEWVEKLTDGDWAGAWQVVSRYNPFPHLTGHVCYRFCQEKCNRLHLDEAVAIGDLEKQIGAWRYNQFTPGKGSIKKIGSPPLKVAIVGSGPAGLACAYYLSLLGSEVVILEREPVAGGMLALCIPEYRLPRLVLEQELAMLRAMGVVFRCGVEVGRDISLEALQSEYQAVFLAAGATRLKQLGIDGEELPGIMNAVDYLAAVHLGRSVPAAGSVIVVGGGNAAIDAACVARLRGARVVLAYRRTREAMPAHEDEIRAAEAAGVQFLFQVQPDALLGSGGRLGKVRMVRTEVSKRGEGVTVIPGSSFTLECELLLAAAGQEPDLGFAGSNLKILDGCMTNLPGVFAGGDLCTGPGNVAEAISAGREGARAIAAYLEMETAGVDGQVFPPVYKEEAQVISYQHLNPFLFGRQGRSERPEQEAGRCLSCGRCNGCAVCWMFCPDLAVDSGADLDFLLDYCKGCGICAKECPSGVLEMEVADSGTENNHR
ncbi:MAG: FAD-dependent oxidoreductase [Dethiobacter sp.]|nr:FAD-dependent oxidoreductase [Dethiobacter sp.]